MAVMLTIEGTYKVASVIAGKKDLKEFRIQKPWPISMEDEDFDEMNAANFYIKNFFLDKWLRDDKEISKEYWGLHSCSVEGVRQLDDDEIQNLLDSGELLAIDPDSISAKDVNEMKKRELISTVIMMDGDQTPFMAQNKSLWQSRNEQDMRSVLKDHLGLEDEVEIVKAKNKKRTSKLLGGESKEEKPKRKRAPRKAKETVEMTD